jgi:outer membrane protein OmpA-like peptidoglycan-associated protein
MLSVLGAARFARWEVDGGVSWLYSALNGAVAGGAPVSVRTRAGTADLGLRCRLGSGLQLGPALNVAFGTDTSFGPSVGQSQAGLLIGAKAVYEIPRLPMPLRFWAQLSTDTTWDHPFAMGLAGVQVGWPIRRPTETARSQDAAMPDDAIRISSAAPSRPVSVVLDARRVFFGTKSSRLRPEIARALREVGRFLKDSGEGDAPVRIAGHADQRGRFEYNLELSRERAESVRRQLAAGGMEPDALEVEAFSFLKPLDPANNRAAWAKNRRVEITFDRVRDPDALREALERLGTDQPAEVR